MGWIPKKSFGQHFLTDPSVLDNILDQIPLLPGLPVLEIGPGRGALTERLLPRFGDKLFAIELDNDLIPFLQKKFPHLSPRLFHQDFLRFDISSHFPDGVVIVGNFPYNISSQIVFRIIENREVVPFMLGMFQREMATRITAQPPARDTGVISFLTQVYFETKHLFDIPASAFSPPPKVWSSVISLSRNEVKYPPCDEKLFIHIVKTTFQNRRKMLRNTLLQTYSPLPVNLERFFTKRPEELTLNDWYTITKAIEEAKNGI